MTSVRRLRSDAAEVDLDFPVGGRLVAVLGYSVRRAEGLHAVCAARLERAYREAEGADAVILSGWSRRRGRLAEAELMRQAWPPSSASVLCDPAARTTAENAARVVRLARAVGAAEIRVVTSWWHAPRAWVFFRAQLRGAEIRVSVATAGRPAMTVRSWGSSSAGRSSRSSLRFSAANGGRQASVRGCVTSADDLPGCCGKPETPRGSAHNDSRCLRGWNTRPDPEGFVSVGNCCRERRRR